MVAQYENLLNDLRLHLVQHLLWCSRSARGLSAASLAHTRSQDLRVVAEELTICGHVKGTIHANRVKLNSTAVVEGDIFHRSLSIEENARFEGSSKRENNAGDVPGAPLRRPVTRDHFQTDVTAIEGDGNCNGTQTHGGHTNA